MAGEEEKRERRVDRQRRVAGKDGRGRDYAIDIRGSTNYDISFDIAVLGERECVGVLPRNGAAAVTDA